MARFVSIFRVLRRRRRDIAAGHLRRDDSFWTRVSVLTPDDRLRRRTPPSRFVRKPASPDRNSKISQPSYAENGLLSILPCSNSGSPPFHYSPVSRSEDAVRSPVSPAKAAKPPLVPEFHRGVGHGLVSLAGRLARATKTGAGAVSVCRDCRNGTNSVEGKRLWAGNTCRYTPAGVKSGLCRARGKSMTEPALREPEQIRQECVRKLRPIETSGMFTAILGCLLGEDWATPRIEQLIVTDKCLLARTEGEVTHKLFLGAGGRRRPDPQCPRYCQDGGAGRGRVGIPAGGDCEDQEGGVK